MFFYVFILVVVLMVIVYYKCYNLIFWFGVVIVWGLFVCEGVGELLY